MTKIKNSKQVLMSLLVFGFMGLFLLLPQISLATSPTDVFTDPNSSFFSGLNLTGKNALYQSDDGGVVIQGNATYINFLIAKIIAMVIGLTGTVFLVLIIYSGWQWLTAGGEEEKITKAKNRIKNGVIGLGLCLLAFGIASFANNFLASKFLKPPTNSTPTIEAPAGETIVCSSNIQCRDRGFLRICSNGRCVECQFNADCSPVSGQVQVECINNRCVDTAECSKKDIANCKKDDNDQCNYVKDTNSCMPILNSRCVVGCVAPKNTCYKGECVQECTGADASQCTGGPFGLQGFIGSCQDGICSW